MSQPRVIVVAKRSAWRRFVVEEEDPRVRLLLRKRDPSVARWKRAYDDHRRTVTEVRRAVEDLGARLTFVRGAHQRFDTESADLVVSVGGDGTLLAASHNVHDVPILGVNSAPTSSVGFFCGARRTNVKRMIADALDGTIDKVRLTRMQVEVNGRIRSRRVLNEALFCHSSPAATARYILRAGGHREEQRSSGIWVGPAAGSTAAQKSAGGRVLPLASKKLQLVVREPYVPPKKHYRLTRVLIPVGGRASLHSKMSDARVFLDGPDERFTVRLGDNVVFRASDQPLVLLGISSRRQR